MMYLPRTALGLLLVLCATLGLAQTEVVISEAHLTFTTIDVPGAVATNVLGINSVGDMVGDYSLTSGAPGRGFLLKDGTFTLFDYPGGNDTLPGGINDQGLISGSAFVHNYTVIVSFVYNGSTFTTLRAPHKNVTLAHGINNRGVIGGGYGTLAATQGFVLVGNQFSMVSPPGNYINVFVNGVNNLQQIVGTADDSGFFQSHGHFKTIAVPGSTATQPWGINDNAIIVGSFEKCSPCAFHGFVRKNGKYLTVDYPGAMETFASGINNAGEIVGSYTFDQQTYHGFVTSPIKAAEFERPGDVL